MSEGIILPFAKVSVIIPTRNRPFFLARAIESVLKQRFQDWNLIIVNDGGEEVSHVLEDFHDPRLHYLSIPPSGKSAALNRGLLSCDSVYIGYLDDDDIHYPNHLELLVEALERNPEAVMAYSDTYRVLLRKQGEAWREAERTVENREEVTLEMLLERNYINHKNLLHRRSVLERTGLYDEQLEVLIDWDIVLRLFAAGPAVHVREITGEHFLHSDQASPILNSLTAMYYEDRERYQLNRRRVLAKMVYLPLIAAGLAPFSGVAIQGPSGKIAALLEARFFQLLEGRVEEIRHLRAVCEEQWQALQRIRASRAYRIYRLARRFLQKLGISEPPQVEP